MFLGYFTLHSPNSPHRFCKLPKTRFKSSVSPNKPNWRTLDELTLSLTGTEEDLLSESIFLMQWVSVFFIMAFVISEFTLVTRAVVQNKLLFFQSKIKLVSLMPFSVMWTLKPLRFNFFVLNWNNFEMRLLNLNINYFIYCRLYVLILVVFVLFLLSLSFKPLSLPITVF